jgi:hypothetical protein
MPAGSCAPSPKQRPSDLPERTLVLVFSICLGKLPDAVPVCRAQPLYEAIDEAVVLKKRNPKTIAVLAFLFLQSSSHAGHLILIS